MCYQSNQRKREASEKGRIRCSHPERIITGRERDIISVAMTMNPWISTNSGSTNLMPSNQEYIESILRNIQLRDHVLQLQAYPATLCKCLDTRHSTLRILTPNSYKQFKGTLYSILDTLLSRTNVPTPLEEMPFLGDSHSPRHSDNGHPSTSWFGQPRRSSSKSSDILASPCWKLYGNELNKSHRRADGHAVSQSARGAIPLHETSFSITTNVPAGKTNIF
jgi:hypothetical protein